MTPDGWYLTKEICIYHYGRLRKAKGLCVHATFCIQSSYVDNLVWQRQEKSILYIHVVKEFLHQKAAKWLRWVICMVNIRQNSHLVLCVFEVNSITLAVCEATHSVNAM